MGSFGGLDLAARTLVTPGTSVPREGNSRSAVNGSLDLKLCARHWLGYNEVQ